MHSHLRLARIHWAYERFVPKEFLMLLGKEDIIDLGIGEHQELEMAVLFADIRNFTAYSERLGSRKTFDLLNRVFDRLSPVVQKHGGFVDKYIGDALMALFPSPGKQCLACIVEIFQELEAHNRVYAEEYGEVEIGIGLHCGSLVVGTVGTSERMDTTVISDTVNVASRIEGTTKMFGVRALISEPFVRMVCETEEEEEERGREKEEGEKDSGFAMRWVGEVKLKGKKDRMGLYELLACYGEEKRRGLAEVDLQEVLFSGKNGAMHEEAPERVRELEAQYPQDSVVRYYKESLGQDNNG